jgi:hypothetical protein
MRVSSEHLLVSGALGTILGADEKIPRVRIVGGDLTGDSRGTRVLPAVTLPALMRMPGVLVRLARPEQTSAHLEVTSTVSSPEARTGRLRVSLQPRSAAGAPEPFASVCVAGPQPERTLKGRPRILLLAELEVAPSDPDLELM